MFYIMLMVTIYIKFQIIYLYFFLFVIKNFS